MPIRALYVCYFGLREPLVQTQVLPYLRELAAGGIDMTLLTFERDAPPLGAWRDDAIKWHALPYHKRAWLKPFDIIRGAWLARRGNFDVIHGRSHVGTAIGAMPTLFTKRKLI